MRSSIKAEPLGMVSLEAMFVGRSVLSTTTGGPADVLENGRNGMRVQPGDLEALAAQVSALFSDDELRRTIGDAGRAMVISRLLIKNTVREVEAIYDSLSHRLGSAS